MNKVGVHGRDRSFSSNISCIILRLLDRPLASADDLCDLYEGQYTQTGLTTRSGLITRHRDIRRSSDQAITLTGRRFPSKRWFFPANGRLSDD